MAQNYSELRKDNVRDAIYEDVANNLEVLRTSWAGNSFPENPKVGQACYRIDEDNLYFWDGTTWSQKGGGGIDMNTGDKLYDWVGTLAEYREQDIENQHPEYLCYITDDLVDSREAMSLPVGFIGLVTFPIDESLDLQKYANGQTIPASKFPELVKNLKSNPQLCVDEDTWQAEKTLSKLGQCGKYVLDEENNTIRLPLIINAQGLSDLSTIGGIKDESLPNVKEIVPSSINGDFGNPNDTNSLFANGTASGYDYGVGSYGTTSGFDFNMSRKNSTYQDDAPVQQEAIQYPYFIQVATGVEESLPAIREYKLNNPHFLGESKWTDVDPNNASWLLSDGTYYSGATYGDYYQWLLKIYNKTETVEGVSVKGVSDEYTDYDFVINTADTTFRLPLLNGEESLPDYENGLSIESLPFTAKQKGTVSLKLTRPDLSAAVFVNGVDISSDGLPNQSGAAINTIFDVKKGDVVTANQAISRCLFFPNTGNGSLYFYVGDTLQDPTLITATGVLKDIEALKQNKADVSVVNGKANTNASNFSATGKETIVSWGMPDYSAGITNSTFPYTAQNACFLFAVFQRTRDQSITMTLNNVTTNLWTGEGTYNSYNETIQLPLSKGDRVTFNFAPNVCRIYPLKGVL